MSSEWLAILGLFFGLISHEWVHRYDRSHVVFDLAVAAIIGLTAILLFGIGLQRLLFP